MTTKYTVLLGGAEEPRGFSYWVEAEDYHGAIDAATAQAEKDASPLSGSILWVAEGHITDLSAQDH